MLNIESFFKPKLPIGPNDLPGVEQTVINAINASVMETPKRKRPATYNRFDADERLKIADLGNKYGASKAATLFSREVEKPITESTVRSIIRQWKRASANVTDGHLENLPKKSGATTKLPTEIDNLVIQVMLY